jgi:hypothetical protein
VPLPEVLIMRASRILAVMLALGALGALAGGAGCTGLQVTSDVNPDLKVSVCTSYAWAGAFRADGGNGPSVANPLIESRLRTAIAANLQSKGVLPAAAGTEAACLVGYGIGRRTIVEGGYPVGWGPGWGWPGGYGWGGPWGWDGPTVQRRGLVAINLYQTQGRQPLWHAVVEQDLADLTGHDAEDKVNAAVAVLFSKYPH